MIIFVQTIGVQPGKMKEATALTAKMLAYFKDINAPGQSSFVRNISGNLHQIHMCAISNRWPFSKRRKI